MKLLLAPGLFCDARVWTAQVAALADVADVRVASLGPHDSIVAMADALLVAAPPRFALAGFSLGGCVAIEMALRAPERVERLALLSTNAGGVTPVVRTYLSGAIAGVEAGGLDAYLEGIFPHYFGPESVHDRALHDTFVAMAHAIGAAAGARQMHALLDYAGRDGAALARIAAPTTVIAGRFDERIPVATQSATAEQIPGAAFRIIDGSGHFTPIERPDATSAALREWLVTRRDRVA